MRIGLLDPFAGVAGDMFVGALLDAGAPFDAVREGLAALELDEYEVSLASVQRCGIAAGKYRVTHREGHHHRGLTEIRRLIEKASLSDAVRERALDAFQKLGEAEAKVHGVDIEKVHFHEVGAVDAICDIVGAALAFDALGIERLYARPLPLFYGMVDAAHGRIPLPAPATMELMRDWPVFDSGREGELVTPTGAALVTAWATPDAPPPFAPKSIGYGAGDRDPEGYPNVCRLIVGETTASGASLWQLECEMDDATPQVLGYLLGQLLDAGALDATLTPVQMKKNRPGTRVTVLTRAETIATIEERLFREGTTLGVRRHLVERTELPRRIVRVETPYGTVGVKVGELGGEVVHVAPEYEDCRRLAQEHGVPLREVTRAAMAKWAG
ncbi:MAG: nickel pincer cofactor biosynthesis protein LarC [Planctomycetota bacterium]